MSRLAESDPLETGAGLVTLTNLNLAPDPGGSSLSWAACGCTRRLPGHARKTPGLGVTQGVRGKFFAATGSARAASSGWTAQPAAHGARARATFALDHPVGGRRRGGAGHHPGPRARGTR